MASGVQSLVPVPPTTDTMKALSDDVRIRCAGGSGEQFGADEPGVEQVHEEPAFKLDIFDNTVDLDESVIMEVGELVAEDMDIPQKIQIRSREVIAFVIIKYNPETDNTWTIPEPMVYSDLLNRVEGQIWEDRNPCSSAYRWANLWGKVGLLGLAPTNKEHINEYRRIIEQQELGCTRSSMVPKDALDSKGNVSVLLRLPFRSFKREWLASSILNRTRGLMGSLRVTHSKTYTHKDFTRNGTCKDGWRLFLLQGCPTFMDALSKYGHDYRFPLGCGHVLIRGGSGRPRGDTGPDGPRGRTRGRGMSEPSNQEHRQSTQERQGRNRSRAFSSDFPANGMNNSSIGGGPGRGRGALPSTWASAARPGRGAPR